jgi:hypothetical protein
MDEKYNELKNYSNPTIVKKKAVELFGKNVKLAVSTRKQNKYMIQRPDGKWVHFGSWNPPMEDYTFHKNEVRRRNYLARSKGIKGDWAKNPYSPNSLSVSLLWNG